MLYITTETLDHSFTHGKAVSVVGWGGGYTTKLIFSLASDEPGTEDTETSETDGEWQSWDKRASIHSADSRASGSWSQLSSIVEQNINSSWNTTQQQQLSTIIQIHRTSDYTFPPLQHKVSSSLSSSHKKMLGFKDKSQENDSK